MLDKHILDSPEVGTDVRGLVVSSDVGICEVLRPDVGVEVRVDVKFDVGEGVGVDVCACEGELDSDVEADDGASVVLGAEVQDEVRVKVVLKEINVTKTLSRNVKHKHFCSLPKPLWSCR